jgi:Conserved region of unknown function on GLTSCR protein
LTADHISALFPDVDSPFRGIEDVVDRLLPYHVFQHPREDLLKVGKGKQKATETDILRSELEGAPVLPCEMLCLCSQYIQKQNLHWSASNADENWRNAFVVPRQNLARHAVLHIFASANANCTLVTSAQRPMTKRIILNDKCSTVSAPNIPH